MKELNQEQAIVIRKNILYAFHNICQEKNIKYSLGYGTLLGSIRHKGMIPWDDDVDVLVSREDFERLCFLYSSHNCKDKYQFVSHRNHPEIKTKIGYFIDYDTVTETAFKKLDYHGIHIDVYPVDIMPNSNIRLRRMMIERKFLQTLLRAKDVHPNVVNGWHKMIRECVLTICKPFNEDKAIEKLHNISSKYSHMPENQKKTACVFVDSEGPSFFPYSITKEYAEYEYEGHTYYGYEDYDTLLKSWYGDYMTPPPIDKQVRPDHTFVKYYQKDKEY